MIKSKIIVSGLLFAVMSVATAQAQEVTARIPELETNETYMTLMRNDARLRFKTDSLLGVVRQLRGELNRNAESRDSLAQQRSDSISVLLNDAEAAIFATRAQKIKLIDQINTIEQEQVLSSLGNIGEAQGSSSSGSIYTNSYFRNSIEAEDFKALMASHGKEADAQSHAQAYVKNYNRIKELYDKYVLAQTEAEAENIYTELSTMRDENMVLERQLTKLWTEIYDQKSYVYSYFLEKEGREDVLELAENMMSEARQEKLISIDNCVSEPLADYRLQKPVILNYEVYVAKLSTPCRMLRVLCDRLIIACRRSISSAARLSIIRLLSLVRAAHIPHQIRYPIALCMSMVRYIVSCSVHSNISRPYLSSAMRRR